MTWPNNLAEEATGVRQTGKLVLYDDSTEDVISAKEAGNLVRRQGTISVPSAGAGSYMEVFRMLGFTEVKEFNTTSSAGDWCLAVKDKDGWRAAWQTNRYPRYGYQYSVDGAAYETYEELVAYLVAMSGL